MVQQRTELSSELLAAQERLNLLQQKRQVERVALGLPQQRQAGGHRADSPPDQTRSLIKQNEAAVLPSHLGWESEPLTAALRCTNSRPKDSPSTATDRSWLTSLSPQRKVAVASPAPVEQQETINLYPDLALGMLRQERTADGRIWLLLRYMDSEGRGWLTVEHVREALTGKASRLRVCGWRQLRNLLSKGEETFWLRRHGRIWLRSLVKVAAALDVWQFVGTSVEIPLQTLLKGIGTVRAHFYASFHSGRTLRTKPGGKTSMPIARETIKTICHISRRTQRKYEKVARVHSQQNYAIGPSVSTHDVHEKAWRVGQALFRLQDPKGRQGAPAVTYLAWQLPNNYLGPHKQQSRGQQKRINRKLADLSMQGMTGNGDLSIENAITNRSQRFYGNGRLAAKAYDRLAGHDIYWRQIHTDRGSRVHRLRFWHHLPGKPG